MRPEKIDKKIMCNEQLDMPSKTVLDAAKSEMEKTRAAKKKLSRFEIWGIVSSCVAVLVVLCCIPFMLPKSDADKVYPKFPSAYGTDKIAISSIADFNAEYGKNVLTFDSAVQNDACIYKKSDGEVVYCRETYTYGDTQIEMWVEFGNYGELMGDDGKKPTYEFDKINGCTVKYVQGDDGRVFARFFKNDCTYMIELTGETSTWKNILENFIK